jgi:hypothetical protein
MNDRRISPELAARATAAEAANADFRRAWRDYLKTGGDEPDWTEWACRLSSELSSLLSAIAIEPGPGTAMPGGGWISGGSQS